MEWLDQALIPGVSVAELLASVAMLLITVLVAYSVRWISPRLSALLARRNAARPLLLIQKSVHLPLLALIWIYGLAISIFPLLPAQPTTVRWVLLAIAHGLGLVAIVWLAVRLTYWLMRFTDAWALNRESLFDRYFIPLFVRATPVIVPVLALFVFLPLLTLPDGQMTAIRNLASLLLIAVIAAVLIQAVNMADRLIVSQLQIDVADNLSARRMYTQISVLRKFALLVIIVIALASMLMVFEKVRQLGTSLLASAGILSLTLGIAAQQVLGNLIAGIQIAFSQPIRLDDVVVVEGEWGQIEELTLTYVVVRVWDQRRLVLPIKYFIEQPFQNWTRQSSELIGAVFFYLDYEADLDALRIELQRIVAASPLWDQRVCSLQVTDFTERVMQVRVLVSAANGSDAFSLRCLVREQLIAFVRDNDPQSLPRMRATLTGNLNA